MKAAVRALTWVLLAIPPIVATLWAGFTDIGFMIDLDVYIRTAKTMLHHGNVYQPIPNTYPFIYPPFAALLAAPLALAPRLATEIGWLVLNTAVVVAMVHRLGFRGWKLSAVATAAVWFIEPLRHTLGYGQVNLFLMALVLLDLFGGDRILPFRRLLPRGTLTGAATAIKLTPAIFAVYLFLAGRVRTALTIFFSFVACTVVGFVLMPSQSQIFWGKLLRGDSGINVGLKFVTNQSIVGNYVRWTKEDVDRIPAGGLAIAAVVAVIGIIAAVLWHRTGEEDFAVCLAALTGLLASPISWSHHFVWALPILVIALRSGSRLPTWLRAYAVFTCLWIAHAPFTKLPEFKEMSYRKWQLLVDSGDALLGTGLLVLAIAAALLRRREDGEPLLPRWEPDLAFLRIGRDETDRETEKSGSTPSGA
ncbi:alpha-(1-2)-phosphatidylinositol mannoside mannosyltransferase [Mariniluteicoccus flavus]